ncbi:MAG: hypothetical protein L3J11_03425 [Draconibacterium sp.]|nr:hypothetical protein [Draconibacterium sp.]
MKFVITIILFFLFTNCTRQISSDGSFISKFKSIDKNPSIICFSNSKKINNNGGHIQGVQLIQRKTGKYAILTGSSDAYSYYSVVKLGGENKVVSVNQLMDKPFKHAGGFQIFQNYLAVGIEDNSAKDKSKVCIYDISDPENPSVVPISVIERAGEPMRSTAGCVGITKYKNKALIAVGDWDTKNIDFYTCNFDEMGKNCFEKIYSIDTEKQLKKDWINKDWFSYQNINLFSINQNKLFLFGLGQNKKSENIADLFSLNEDAGKYSLIKLASKTFNCTNKTSFQASAGVELDDDGEMTIISSGYNIENGSYLNSFVHCKSSLKANTK